MHALDMMMVPCYEGHIAPEVTIRGIWNLIFNIFGFGICVAVCCSRCLSGHRAAEKATNKKPPTRYAPNISYSRMTVSHSFKHWRLVHCLLYSTSPSPCRSINTVTIAQTTPCGTYVHAYAAFYLIIKHKQTVYTFVDFIVKLLTCCRQCLTVLGLFFCSKQASCCCCWESHPILHASRGYIDTVPPTRRDLLALCTTTDCLLSRLYVHVHYRRTVRPIVSSVAYTGQYLLEY